MCMRWPNNISINLPKERRSFMMQRYRKDNISQVTLWSKSDRGQFRENPKLWISYQGPYVVLERLGIGYKLLLDKDKNDIIIVNHNQLKLYEGLIWPRGYFKLLECCDNQLNKGWTLMGLSPALRSPTYQWKNWEPCNHDIIASSHLSPQGILPH